MIFGYFRRPRFQIGDVGLLIGGSVVGLCLCLWLCCGWVVAEVAGSSGFPMGFLKFFFFNFKYGFLFWWDFGEQWAVVAWVFVPMGLCLCVCF